MTRRNSTERNRDDRPDHRLDRRHFLIALAGVPALAAVLAACGDPDVAPGDTAPGSTGSPTSVAGSQTSTPGTAPGAATIEHPTGADDVVIRIGNEGGFVPVGVAFQRVPFLLISGDGRAFLPGMQPAIYPGPLLPAFSVAPITEDGVQRILATAAAHGLLTDPVPSYDADIQVADAPDTVVEFHAKGGLFRHVAPALGFNVAGGGEESTPARRDLLAFKAEVDEMMAAGGRGLGDGQIFVPERFRVQARVVTLADFDGQDVEPTVSPWPADAGFRLVDATECALGSGSVITDLLTSANTLSLFTEDGIAYQLCAVAELPGDTC